MALLAYNLTLSPLVITAGDHSITLPASLVDGERGLGVNCQGEFRLLTVAQQETLEALRVAEDLDVIWSDQPEYGTGALYVRGAQVDAWKALELIEEGGGGGSATLQDAYGEGSGSPPTILLTAELGGFVLRNSDIGEDDWVAAIRDSDGETTHLGVKGNGNAYAHGDLEFDVDLDHSISVARPNSGDVAGGSLSLEAANGHGSGAGGDFESFAGNGAPATNGSGGTGNGGSWRGHAGNGGNQGGSGGNVELYGGDALAGEAGGGDVDVAGGDGGTIGGAVTISGGRAPYGEGATWGDVELQPDGGDVVYGDPADPTLKVTRTSLTFKGHSGFAGSGATEETSGVETTTTEATVLWELVLADGFGYTIGALVTARNQDGSEHASWKLILSCHREGAGAVLDNGGNWHLEYASADNPAAWGIDVDTDGNNVRVRVTGEADKTITWTAVASYQGAGGSAGSGGPPQS